MQNAGKRPTRGPSSAVGRGTPPVGQASEGRPLPAAGGRKATSGHRAVAPKKNALPLILGGVGGGLLLIILLVFALGSGGGGGAKKKELPVAEPAVAKPKPPDVSHLENDGKKKCEDGMSACDAKGAALAGTPADQKEKVRQEIEAGIKLIDEGLALFKKAKEMAGKNYNLDAYEKAKAKALKRWAADVEGEAQQACDEGLRIFQSTEALMTGGALTDEQNRKLKEDLLKAKHLLEHGNNLRERSQTLTGHQFDTVVYGKAYKALKQKLLELK